MMGPIFRRLGAGDAARSLPALDHYVDQLMDAANRAEAEARRVPPRRGDTP